MDRLTFGGNDFSRPTWSPDSQFVVFGSFAGLFWARADGASQPQPLAPSKTVAEPWSITPDGKRWLFSAVTATTALDRASVVLENSRRPVEGQARRSRSSRRRLRAAAAASLTRRKWLAYMSNPPGRSMYVRAFPDNGGLWKISNNGGQTPDLVARWTRPALPVRRSGDGRELFGQRRHVRPGKPRVWLAKLGGMACDLSPDGKHLLVLTPVDSPDAPKAEHEVVLLQNFFDYVRKHVPAGK